MTNHDKNKNATQTLTTRSAMIMAAGLGTRMRPLTDDRPKPLVELNNKALIDYALDRLVEIGVERVIVNTHYLADVLEDHLKGVTGLEVIISDERAALLDTGGGAARALKDLGSDPFFVINSDSVWLEGVGRSLARMCRLWDDATMDCMLLIASTVNSVGYSGLGDFVMDEQGHLKRRSEGNVAPFVNTGAYLIHPRMFHDLPDGPFSMNLLWDRAIEDGRLFGIRHDGIWMHVGTPEALEQAEELLADHDQ